MHFLFVFGFMSFCSFWHNLGEAMQQQEWTQFMNFLSSFKVRVISVYGTSECPIVVGCRLQNIDYTTVPIGKPLPGIRCLLINEQGQIIDNTNNSNEIGQIHIGGEEYSFQSFS
jgi:acyl-coenzyme A synthetase/AMP-(fatty) acid ligase